MWKYVLNKMIKQKEATFFIVMIILSFAVSSAAPYLNGKFIDLLTVSKDIHLIVQFALIIVGVGVVGALISYCSNLTTVKVLTKTTMASIYEGMDNLLETDLVIAEKLDFSYITQRLFQDANVITSFVLSNFLSIFLNGILIVGVLYCFFVIDPLLCLIVVVVLIPYIVLFLALKRPLFDSSEKKKEADSRLFGSIHSIVEQVFSIQLNSRFSGAKKEAQASFTNCFPFILKAGRLSYLFSSIDSIIQTVFQSVLFIFAGIQIAVGNMTVGEFVMINSYFALLLRAVKYYTAIYKQYQDSLASYKRMRAILAYPKILNGEIDAAIIANQPTENQIQGDTLYYEQFFGYVAKNDPVFKKDMIRTADISDEHLWLLDEGHCFRDQLMRFCQMEKVKLRQAAYRLGSLETFMRMVESGNGVTFIPELATLQLSEDQKKLVRPFAIPKPAREIVWITRKDFIRHTIAGMLIESIKKSVPKEMLTLQAGLKVV